MNEEDRELIRLAAQAGKIHVTWMDPDGNIKGGWAIGIAAYGEDPCVYWNPLENFLQASELAVAALISINHDEPILTGVVEDNGEYEMGVEAWKVPPLPLQMINIQEIYGQDPIKATCRAITRAAAEYAKTMK